VRWSLPIGRLFGIPVKLHLTLLILVGLLLLLSPTPGGGLRLAMLIVLLFVSVLAHELGHALVARRVGVKTREILLLPIGGAAVLESNPKEPRHELWIAAAGPAVSLALGGAAWILGRATSLYILTDLAVINIILGVFNLIPAFPLDGGRMLRAGLAMRFGPVVATRLAARLGRLLAFAGLAFGLVYGHILLAFIAVFVYLAAMAEERSLLLQRALGDRRAIDLMQPVPEVLGAGATTLDAAHLFRERPALKALPVAFGPSVLGVVHRAAAAAAPERPIGELLDRHFITAQSDDAALALLEQMSRARVRAAVVLTDDEVTGVITAEHIAEAIRALMRGPGRGSPKASPAPQPPSVARDEQP